ESYLRRNRVVSVPAGASEGAASRIAPSSVCALTIYFSEQSVRTEGEKGDWTECHDVNTVVSMTQGLDAGPRAACATAVPAAGDVGGPRFATPMPPGHDQLTQRLSRPCRRQPTQRVDEAAAVRRHLLLTRGLEHHPTHAVVA